MAVGASSQRCSVFRFSKSTEASRIPPGGTSYASNLNMLRLLETLSIRNCFAALQDLTNFWACYSSLGTRFVALYDVWPVTRQKSVIDAKISL
jgi:hypothetical protein